MAAKFIVLFTHQKVKKAKSWRDGSLEVPVDGKSAILKDGDGKSIDRLSLKSEVHVGDDLESAKYLIQIDDIAASEDLPPTIIENTEPAVAIRLVKKRKLGFKNPGSAGTASNIEPCKQNQDVDDHLLENAGLSFSILYTHQKLKKCKTWQDGTLLISKNGKKGSLKDENDKYIDEISLRSLVVVGDELETAKYLIQIDSAKNDGGKTLNITNAGANTVVGTESVSNKTNMEVSKNSVHYTVRPKKKKFAAPRRTGPPVDSTFSGDVTNPEDEFAGMACTVVRQDSAGIWGITNYNQEAIDEKISQTLSHHNHTDKPVQNDDRKIRSRKDILNFLQQRKNVCKDAPKPTTVETDSSKLEDKENIVSSSSVNRPEINLSIEPTSDSDSESLFLSSHPNNAGNASEYLPSQSPCELDMSPEFSLSPDFSLT